MALVGLEKKLFAQYVSLNLQDKLYQVKAIDLAKKHLARHKGKIKLLDIGCADGSFAQYAGVQLGGNSYGLDICPSAIKRAKLVLNQAFQHDVAKALPFPDHFFDIVFALEVIEHVFDTDFFMMEIRRVLKPGGLLILSTPNLASLKNRARLFFNGYPQYLEYSCEGAGHIHLYTSKILESQLAKHKLKTKEMTSANFLAPYVTHKVAPIWYRKLMMRMGDIFPSLGSHIVVVAKR